MLFGMKVRRARRRGHCVVHSNKWYAQDIHIKATGFWFCFKTLCCVNCVNIPLTRSRHRHNINMTRSVGAKSSRCDGWHNNGVSANIFTRRLEASLSELRLLLAHSFPVLLSIFDGIMCHTIIHITCFSVRWCVNVFVCVYALVDSAKFLVSVLNFNVSAISMLLLINMQIVCPTLHTSALPFSPLMLSVCAYWNVIKIQYNALCWEGWGRVYSY